MAVDVEIQNNYAVSILPEANAQLLGLCMTSGDVPVAIGRGGAGGYLQSSQSWQERNEQTSSNCQMLKSYSRPAAHEGEYWSQEGGEGGCEGREKEAEGVCKVCDRGCLSRLATRGCLSSRPMIGPSI